jgi:hypothetical protein
MRPGLLFGTETIVGTNIMPFRKMQMRINRNYGGLVFRGPAGPARIANPPAAMFYRRINDRE